MAMIVCGTCTQEFAATPNSRFPNWTPKDCPSCYRAKPRAGTKRHVDSPAMDLVTDDGIYTDGSCLGNPGPGGWAFVRAENGEARREEAGGEPLTTNNRMELMAMIRALESTAPEEAVTILSDSKLILDTLDKWAAGWAARGWTKRDGKPVMNLDLVQAAYELRRSRPNVRLAWLKGHAGHTWNERANDLAQAEAEAQAAATGARPRP